MVNIPFETHLAFHVPIVLWLWLHIFQNALDLGYGLRSHQNVLGLNYGLHYIIKMHSTLHVLFETLVMVYIFFKMQLALHVPIKTLIMAYVPFKMHLTLAMVKILIKMHLTDNNIIDVSFET